MGKAREKVIVRLKPSGYQPSKAELEKTCGPKKGRGCCLKPGVDSEFQAADNDPHNLGTDRSINRSPYGM